MICDIGREDADFSEGDTNKLKDNYDGYHLLGHP